MQCGNIRRFHLSSGLLGPVCRRHLSLDSAADTLVSSVICESVGNFRQPKDECFHPISLLSGGCSGLRCLVGWSKQVDPCFVVKLGNVEEAA